MVIDYESAAIEQQSIEILEVIVVVIVVAVVRVVEGKRRTAEEALSTCTILFPLFVMLLLLLLYLYHHHQHHHHSNLALLCWFHAAFLQFPFLCPFSPAGPFWLVIFLCPFVCAGCRLLHAGERDKFPPSLALLFLR